MIHADKSLRCAAARDCRGIRRMCPVCHASAREQAPGSHMSACPRMALTFIQWYEVSAEITRKTEKRMRTGKPRAKEDVIKSAMKKYGLLFVELDKRNAKQDAE